MRIYDIPPVLTIDQAYLLYNQNKVLTFKYLECKGATKLPIPDEETFTVVPDETPSWFAVLFKSALAKLPEGIEVKTLTVKKGRHFLQDQDAYVWEALKNGIFEQTLNPEVLVSVEHPKSFWWEDKSLLDANNNFISPVLCLITEQPNSDVCSEYTKVRYIERLGVDKEEGMTDITFIDTRGEKFKYAHRIGTLCKCNPFIDTAWIA